jgi:hypothetical protein
MLGMIQAKLPLTTEDAKVSKVERKVPARDTLTTAGRGAPGGDPLFDASLALDGPRDSRKVPLTKQDGPRAGVVRKLPLTLVDARVSNMERRAPPQENPVQDRGEPVGDPLLDATLEEQEEMDDTTADEGTAVHLDVRHKMKSKFPCTSVVGPEDVHREVGPPKA